ncbi:MAG: OsmC family protein, partial [Acidimicrobiia bacterium]
KYRDRREIAKWRSPIKTEHIRHSIESAIAYLDEHPEKSHYTDSPATAVIEGLKARVTGPGGTSVISDMPEGVGGRGSAPSPGWLLRAAIASCDATVIAMRAAQERIDLSSLEVTVDSESDDRGILGMDDSVPAGPLRTSIRVKIAAEGVSAEKLREIVEWADHHSPVSDALQRAIPKTVEVEVN